MGTDGVFAWAEEEPEGGVERAVEVFEATELADADIEALAETIRLGVLRYLMRQDLIEDDDAEQMLQRRCVGPLADLIPPRTQPPAARLRVGGRRR